GEIAERLHVTRQAVFDGLRRSGRELRRVEASLRLLQARDGGARRRQVVAARLDTLERAIRRVGAGVDAGARRRITTALAAARWSCQRRPRSSTAWAMSKCCRATGADRSPAVSSIPR